MADVLVERRDEAEVAGASALHRGLVLEVLVVARVLSLVVHVRVQVLLPIELRHRDALEGVAVVPVRRRGEREMRGDERDEEYPGLVAVLARLLAQPDLRARGDLAVIPRVLRLAGAGERGQFLAVGTPRH